MPVYLFGLWQGLQLVKEPQRQGWADIFEETKEEHTAEQCDWIVAGVKCHRSHVEHKQSGHSLNLKKNKKKTDIFLLTYICRNYSLAESSGRRFHHIYHTVNDTTYWYS